jgi:hypothetical protein
MVWFTQNSGQFQAAFTGDANEAQMIPLGYPGAAI